MVILTRHLSGHQPHALTYPGTTGRFPKLAACPSTLLCSQRPAPYTQLWQPVHPPCSAASGLLHPPCSAIHRFLHAISPPESEVLRIKETPSPAGLISCLPETSYSVIRRRKEDTFSLVSLRSVLFKHVSLHQFCHGHLANNAHHLPTYHGPSPWRC